MSKISRRTLVRTLVKGMVAGSLIGSTLAYLRAHKHEALFNGEFETGTIPMPGLRVDVTLPPDNYLRVEHVANVKSRLEELREEYKVKSTTEFDYTTPGMHIVFGKKVRNRTGFAHYILLEKNVDDLTRIGVRSHEHGHLLWELDEKELIYQQFTDPNYVKSYVQDTEDFATLCGWIGLKNAGYDLTQISTHPEKKEEILTDFYLKSLVFLCYKD